MKLLILLTGLLGFSAFAAEMRNAYIIDHKSEVVGKDKYGEAICGRIDDGPIIYRTEPKIENNKNQTQQLSSKENNIVAP